MPARKPKPAKAKPVKPKAAKTDAKTSAKTPKLAARKSGAKPAPAKPAANPKPAPKQKPAPRNQAAIPPRAAPRVDATAINMNREAVEALTRTPPQNQQDYQSDTQQKGQTTPIGEYDVTIVGGGPGGSTLAALLARQGRSVAVVERHEFPRFRIGESLLPFSLDIWRNTGVLPRLHEHNYLIKRGARFVIDETLEEECFWFKNGLDHDHPYAFQVQRGPFDKLLLDHARELGVTVLQPCSATGWEITKEAAFLDTDRGRLKSDIICDASGRWTFMSAKQKQRKVHPAHRKITCYAHFAGVTRCEQDPNNIIIVRFGETQQGWFWLIPFSDDTVSVGVVADAEYFKKSRQNPHDFFWDSIKRSRSMAPRMEHAKACCDILLEADFSYVSDKHVGDRWLKIGDAGAFIDPVFSSGVFLSTKAAELAAQSIALAFASRKFTEAQFADYEARIRQGTQVFWAFIDAFYNKDFLKQMVTSRRRPLLQRSITSLLAGDIFNEENQLISYLTGKGGAFADGEAAKLLG